MPLYLHCTSHRACALFPAGRSHALAMNFFDLTARTRVLQRLSRTLGDQKRYAEGRPGHPGDAAVQQCGIQGACQHCDDQVLMVGGLRMHGCVRPINVNVRCNRDGWF